MSYRQGGQYAGVIASSEEGSRITAEIDHFSGYVMVWPLTEPDWRRVARLRLDLEEWSLVSAFYTTMAYWKNLQAFGVETPDLLTIAGEWLPYYEEKILGLRTARAGAGCGETTQAIAAYVQYWRLTELLGVAEDPAFVRPIPNELFELQMNLCWEEAFIRCRVTGDFRSLVFYLVGAYRQYTIMSGEEPPADMRSKAQGYLKRCGHWTVTTKSLVDLVKPAYPWLYEKYGLRTEYDLAWKPTGDEFDLGVTGSTIEGTGEVELDAIEVKYDPPAGCTVELDPGPVKYEPHAKLTELTFNQPEQEWVPGVKGSNGISVGGYWRETGPPVLRGLSLNVYMPLVHSRYLPHCRTVLGGDVLGVVTHEAFFVDLYEWWYDGSVGATRLKRAMIPKEDPNYIPWRGDSGPSPFGLQFNRRWTVCGQPAPYKACVSPPFTAEQPTLVDTGQHVVNGTYSIKLDVSIEHAPR